MKTLLKWGFVMDILYCKLLIWSINRLVNRQKTYQGRLDRLNTIINFLVDEYCDYQKEGKTC